MRHNFIFRWFQMVFSCLSIIDAIQTNLNEDITKPIPISWRLMGFATMKSRNCVYKTDPMNRGNNLDMNWICWRKGHALRSWVLHSISRHNLVQLGSIWVSPTVSINYSIARHWTEFGTIPRPF